MKMVKQPQCFTRNTMQMSLTYVLSQGTEIRNTVKQSTALSAKMTRLKGKIYIKKKC